MKTQLLIFALVGAMFIVIWALTGMDSMWPFWALFGWAVGLAAAAIGRARRHRDTA